MQLLLSPTAPLGLPLPHPEAPLLPLPVWTPAQAAPEAWNAAGALTKARLRLPPGTQMLSSSPPLAMTREDVFASSLHVAEECTSDDVKPRLPCHVCVPSNVTGVCARGLPAYLQQPTTSCACRRRMPSCWPTWPPWRSTPVPALTRRQPARAATRTMTRRLTPAEDSFPRCAPRARVPHGMHRPAVLQCAYYTSIQDPGSEVLQSKRKFS